MRRREGPGHTPTGPSCPRDAPAWPCRSGPTAVLCGKGTWGVRHRGPGRSPRGCPPTGQPCEVWPGGIEGTGAGGWTPTHAAGGGILEGGVTPGRSRRGGASSRPQRWLGRRLEEVAEAVGGGYCRLQMPLRLALGVRGTVAGHRLRALERGGYLTPFQCIPGATLGGTGTHRQKESEWGCALWGGGGACIRLGLRLGTSTSALHSDGAL